MRVSYKRLWKLLIDHNMKKSELRDAAGIGQATLTKLNKDETVSMDVLIKICTVNMINNWNFSKRGHLNY